MVDRDRMELIKRDENEPDIRRLIASITLLTADHQPSHTVAVAADLGWPLSRVETAVLAARERGWLPPAPKRVV